MFPRTPSSSFAASKHKSSHPLP
jgi:hypothetical protein